MKRSFFIGPLIPGTLLMVLLYLAALINPYFINILTWESSARDGKKGQVHPAPDAEEKSFPYTIGSPADLPSASPRQPDQPEYLATEPDFWLQLADELDARKTVVQSPAAVFDVDRDGEQEALVYALAFYPTEDMIPESRDWLLVLDRGPPPHARSAAFRIAARREVTIGTSAPHIRIAPVFDDGSVAVILADKQRADRLTDQKLFRYLPESGRLEPLRFRGGSIGGRGSPDAIAGRIEFYRSGGTLMAEVAYGRELALRSRYRWTGGEFTLAEEEIPRPAQWEAEIINRAAEDIEHFTFAVQLYGSAEKGRAVVYAEDGHYGYYYLYSYRRGDDGSPALIRRDSIRGDPAPFFGAHGINPQEGRGFSYLPSAESFVSSEGPVLPDLSP
jgi:hypothetical protein